MIFITLHLAIILSHRPSFPPKFGSSGTLLPTNSSHDIVNLMFASYIWVFRRLVGKTVPKRQLRISNDCTCLHTIDYISFCICICICIFAKSPTADSQWLPLPAHHWLYLFLYLHLYLYFCQIADCGFPLIVPCLDVIDYICFCVCICIFCQIVNFGFSLIVPAWMWLIISYHENHEDPNFWQWSC